MPNPALRVPGVYVQEQRPRTAQALPTGVPVFIGFIKDDAPVPANVLATADGYGPVPLLHKSQFPGGASAYLGHAVNGFFDNGGSYCYVVAIRTNTTIPAATLAARLTSALDFTAALADVDLVAIPDAHALVDGTGVVESLVIQVQKAMVDHCTALGTRCAVLDALRGKSAQALIDSQLKPLQLPAIGPVNAALYTPWIRTISSGSTLVPPSGQICGIIARTDSVAGVFTAPANVEVQDATDLEADLDPESMAQLFDRGINCIRAFTARGIRVWGARTLSRDAEWRHLNVRRLVLTVLRWIDVNMTWAALEPNVPALWARIERELTTYLNSLWRDGALQGDSAAEAFLVRCDAELNPPAGREAGEVVTQIALAPAVPAEFIVVTVRHRAGTTELT
jgi:hypothetical protein